MRYHDPSNRRPLLSMTTANMERAEREAFTRAFAGSRHDRAPECACSGPGPLCRHCPERDAPAARVSDPLAQSLEGRAS